MSMVVAHNMSAINTKRQFATSARGMSSAMEKLSSGYKINTGKDDPSGLVISEKLRSQINGLQRAQQNTEEAINVMGIAEGALNEMNNILKKMKALAIHSSNTGVTSAEQIAADQAEMDSSIQTLDRIAQTTKFSNENLLNGAKDIAYDRDTLTKGTQQNSLLNTRESNFSQIFKRDNYAVAINFTGTKNASAATGVGDVDFSQQAMKAYLEVDTVAGQPQANVDAEGNFTRDQAFTLTGNKGSRAFRFKVGDKVTDMVSQIKSAADSTGIDAALVFNSAQKIAQTTNGTADGSDVPATDQNFTIEGINSAPANATSEPKQVEFTLSKEMSEYMEANGIDDITFGVSTSGSDVVLSANGIQLTNGWDGKAETLSAAMDAQKLFDEENEPFITAVQENLKMNGDISVADSVIAPEYTITGGPSKVKVEVEDLFGARDSAGNPNGKATMQAQVNWTDLFDKIDPKLKDQFLTDLANDNLKVNLTTTGKTQADFGLSLTITGSDNTTYRTRNIELSSDQKKELLRTGGGETELSISDGIFAGTTIKLENAQGTGYDPTAAVNTATAGATINALQDVEIIPTTAITGGVSTLESKLVAGATATASFTAGAPVTATANDIFGVAIGGTLTNGSATVNADIDWNALRNSLSQADRAIFDARQANGAQNDFNVTIATVGGNTQDNLQFQLQIGHDGDNDAFYDRTITLTAEQRDQLLNSNDGSTTLDLSAIDPDIFKAGSTLTVNNVDKTQVGFQAGTTNARNHNGTTAVAFGTAGYNFNTTTRSSATTATGAAPVRFDGSGAITSGAAITFASGGNNVVLSDGTGFTITVGNAPAADALFGKDVTYSLKLNGNEGTASYTLAATVDGNEYILTNNWDGVDTSLTASIGSFATTHDNGGSAEVANALAGLSYTATAGTVGGTQGAFADSWPGSSTLTSGPVKVIDATTGPGGLYENGAGSMGDLEFRFDNFNLDSILDGMSAADAATVRGLLSANPPTAGLSATVTRDGTNPSNFSVSLNLTDNTGTTLFSFGSFNVTGDMLNEDGETKGTAGSDGWAKAPAGTGNAFAGIDFRITNAVKKDSSGFVGDGTAVVAATDTSANTAVTRTNGTSDTLKIPSNFADAAVSFAMDDIKLAGGAALAITANFNDAAMTPALRAALAGKDFSLGVRMNAGAADGAETYSLVATVDDVEYVINNNWGGTNGGIDNNAETLFSNNNNADANVARALQAIVFNNAGNAIDIDATNTAYQAANGEDLFKYGSSNERLNTGVMTIGNGLYGTNATEGRLQIQFDDFDIANLIKNGGDAQAINNGLINATGPGAVPLQIDTIIENQTTDGKPNGKFLVTLRLTDNAGNSILQLGTFSSDELNLDTDGQSTDENGEAGGWVTINNGSAFDGLKVRLTNSNLRENAGYVGDNTAIDSETAATGVNGLVANASDSAGRTSDVLDFASGTSSAISQTGGLGEARTAGTVAVFNNTLEAGTGKVLEGVAGVTISEEGANSVMFGNNTDGQGRVYVKFLDDNSFELYKDASLSKESLVASGRNGEEIKEANNSGLTGFTLDLAGSGLASKTGVYLSLAGIEGTDGVRYSEAAVNTAADGDFKGKGMFDADRTLLTGVELGTNTSEEGQLYFKNVFKVDADTGEATVQVFAYKHKDMKDADMVASSTTYAVGNVDESGKYTPSSDAEALTVVLNEVRNADNTQGTGLGIVLSVDGAAFDGSSFELKRGESNVQNGNLTFTNLAARVYAQDYGSDAFIKVTQDKGAIFTQYGTNGDNSSKRLIDAGSDGVSVEVRGQDATLSINGMQVKTTGLNLSLATQDIQAALTFNEGKVGSTTLAQVGYGVGSIFTKIGALNLGSSDKITTGDYAGLSGLLNNAGHVTTDKISNFSNGMQLQLGEGAGDQNRTVVAIKSMTSENLGRVTKGGYWETGSAVYTEKTFTMKDVMGGGQASLKVNATLAMSIIDQAISDVSETRAVIGAFQSNLLQTNSNNLSVTIENITKTESGIRDADMADEMAEFTKQQVLQNAAMSMMGQANQASQNVLQLLR